MARAGSPQGARGQSRSRTKQLVELNFRAARWAAFFIKGRLAKRYRRRHRSSRSPLKNGCRTLPWADFARYSISASNDAQPDAAMCDALALALRVAADCPRRPRWRSQSRSILQCTESLRASIVYSTLDRGVHILQRDVDHG
jgi:hypothetical protein